MIFLKVCLYLIVIFELWVIKKVFTGEFNLDTEIEGDDDSKITQFIKSDKFNTILKWFTISLCIIKMIILTITAIIL